MDGTYGYNDMDGVRPEIQRPVSEREKKYNAGMNTGERFHSGNYKGINFYFICTPWDTNTHVISFIMFYGNVVIRLAENKRYRITTRMASDNGIDFDKFFKSKAMLFINTL